MLFLIGSPIGNLGDITLRALEVLKEVAIIAAEDTRRSSILLKRFQINKPLTSFHEHNEARRTSELIEYRSSVHPSRDSIRFGVVSHVKQTAGRIDHRLDRRARPPSEDGACPPG